MIVHMKFGRKHIIWDKPCVRHVSIGKNMTDTLLKFLETSQGQSHKLKKINFYAPINLNHQKSMQSF